MGGSDASVVFVYEAARLDSCVSCAVQPAGDRIELAQAVFVERHLWRPERRVAFFDGVE